MRFFGLFWIAARTDIWQHRIMSPDKIKNATKPVTRYNPFTFGPVAQMDRAAVS
jgi:hypothetical protein